MALQIESDEFLISIKLNMMQSMIKHVNLNGNMHENYSKTCQKLFQK